VGERNPTAFLLGGASSPCGFSSLPYMNNNELPCVTCGVLLLRSKLWFVNPLREAKFLRRREKKVKSFSSKP